MLKGRSALHGALTLGVSLFGLAAAHAQTPADQGAEDAAGRIGDIIVTAQKRSTSLQKTPLAVTALNSDALQNAQVRGIQDLNGLVPSLKIGDSTGYPQVTVRGIGINNFVPLAESAVALNVNEAYVSRPVAFLGGFYDISSLEVLRGPQGTLYGRNATAGAVNITTARPTEELSGYGVATVGNYGLLRVEGAVGGALVEDRLLVRVAGFRETRNGYGKNITTGSDVDDKDSYGVRGTVVFRPTPELKATIVAEYFKQSDNGGASHYGGLPATTTPLPPSQVLGAIAPSNPRDVANIFDPKFRLRTTAITGILEWGSGPFSVRSITGYRDQTSFNRASLTDGDPGTYFISGEPAHQFTQELQAHYDTSTLHITGGLYYFREHDEASPGSLLTNNAVLNLVGYPFPGLNFPVPGYSTTNVVKALQKVRAKAAFGEVTYNVTDAVSFTAGLRYSSERKQLFNRYAGGIPTPYNGDFLSDAVVPTTVLPARTFHSTTPKIGLQYQVDPDTMIYATYAKGFKSGGFSSGASDAVAGTGFRPEKLTDYEGGIKTKLFDDRLRLNLAGFYYDYTDLQVQTIQLFSLVTVNAGSAHVYGVEAEFTALPTPNLTIEGNASWLRARYVDYIGLDVTGTTGGFFADYKGKKLNNAPSFQSYIASTYRIDLSGGSVLLRGELEYSARFYFDPTNLATTSQPAFAKAHASLAYESAAGWHAKAYVRNIANKRTITAEHLTGAPFLGTIISTTYAPPRTFGLELGYKF